RTKNGPCDRKSGQAWGGHRIKAGANRFRNGVSWGESAHRDHRADAVTGKSLEDRVESELLQVLRGGLTSDHDATMHFFDGQVANPAVGHLVDEARDFVNQ